MLLNLLPYLHFRNYLFLLYFPPMLELASIVILGIVAQWAAWRIKLPAIFPLILIGLLAGPIASLDIFLGEKLIDPSRIFNQEGNILNYFVSLSVGIILFEGGLTLKLKEVRQVATTVRNLIIVGPIISLIGGGLAAHYILGIDIKIALLFGALIIVTGPTVIGPILRNVHPNIRVGTILRWESIIIDPIGALVAVLMYEFILSGGAGAQFTLTALITFGKTVVSGVVMGIFCAWVLYFLLKKHLVPDYLTNVVSLALVFIAFVGADLIASESGLLAVTIMGMILANLKIPEISSILNFKESLTVLLISILFIILSANIEVEQLKLLGWGSLIIFMVVILVLRPLSVFISSIGSNLNWKERIFISWIGPRGIVAAAIASIFALSIIENGSLSPSDMEDARLLIPLTFLIILGTVMIQGGSAKMVATWLGVTKKDPEGFLILGAHEAARLIAKYLQDNSIHAMLVDTSHTNVNEAKMMNLQVSDENILSDELVEKLEVTDLGIFMAMTSNNELNIFACRKFKKDFGRSTNYRLITRNEMKFNSLVRPKYLLFGSDDDYYKLLDVARKNPFIHEFAIEKDQDLNILIARLPNESIPLFIRSEDNHMTVIQVDAKIRTKVGDKLVYMGKKLDTQTNQEDTHLP